MTTYFFIQVLKRTDFGTDFLKSLSGGPAEGNGREELADVEDLIPDDSEVDLIVGQIWSIFLDRKSPMEPLAPLLRIQTEQQTLNLSRRRQHSTKHSSM